MIQRTLSIIKPDATKRNLTGTINQIIESNGLKIIAQKRIKLNKDLAKKFYEVHKEKSFYNDRLSFQFRNLMDLEYKGYFIELNTEYKLSNKITSSFAINYIKGDENHPNSLSNEGDDYEKALDYPLNQMENFSHYRMQIKYSF